MKIFELRRGDWFKVAELPELPILRFDHMDGFYCYAETADGQVANIAGFVEAVRVPAPEDNNRDEQGEV